jgi:hypothetical protein
MAANEANPNRQEEARAALTGEEWRNKITEREKTLAARREEARRAMEGPTQKERRRAKEQAATEGEAAKQAQAKKEAQGEVAAEKARRAQAQTAARAEAAQVERFAFIKDAGRKIEELKNSNLNLSPIRTLKTDMAQAVRGGGMSLGKIAAANTESATPSGQPPSGKTHGAVGPFLTLIFILLLAGGGAYWWFNFRETPTVNLHPNIRSIVFAEENEELNAGPLTDPAALQNALAAASLNYSGRAPAIKNIYLTLNGRPVNGAEFVALTQINLPPELNRYLTGDYMFGNYFDGTESAKFLILQTSFFERTWSAMLAAEPELTTNLSPLLRGQTASPTERQIRFQDKTLRNKDIRFAANQSGETILLYAFLDQRHLVIAESESVFVVLFQRFVANSS